MQSAKKHRKPKNDKVNATEFAKAYAANVGSRDKALINVKNLALVSRTKSTDAALSKEDQKHYTKLANFWDNVSGHIGKL
jgi:hypothetical protein